MDAGPCLAGYEGGFALADSLRSKAVHVCFAVSSCKGPGLCPAPWNHESVCRNLRDAMLGGLNKIDSEGVLNPDRHIFDLQCDPDAGCFVKTNGFLDAWGRRYAANVFPPTAQSYLNDWTYNGSCNPAAISACPTPIPTPQPTPVPTPSASPSDGDGIVPKLNECPKGWPTKVDFVTIGERPWRAPANPNSWLFNVTPRRSDAKYCLDENGKTRGVPCEEWIPCALRQNEDGSWVELVSAKAWGPGFDGDNVERRGNNPNLLNLLLGPEGSPPGHYKICVAPTDEEIGTGSGMCREYDLTLP